MFVSMLGSDYSPFNISRYERVGSTLNTTSDFVGPPNPNDVENALEQIAQSDPKLSADIARRKASGENASSILTSVSKGIEAGSSLLFRISGLVDSIKARPQGTAVPEQSFDIAKYTPFLIGGAGLIVLLMVMKKK